MELQQLKGFLAVAKLGSFSKAALATHRTQPAVSLQVGSLEEELGTALFERLRDKTILTPEGELLRSLASPLIEEFDRIEDKFKELRGEFKGSISIATHNSVMLYLLPEAIERFRSEFPAADLSLLNRACPDIIKLVEEREVDLGITSMTRVPAHLEYKRLEAFKRVLITPKNHPLTKKRNLTLSDIASFPLILPPHGSNTRKAVESAFQDADLNLQIAMEIAGRDSVKEYVKMGLGISILNEYYMPSSSRRSLALRDVSRFFGKAERGVVTLKNRRQSQWVRRFLEMLGDEA